MADAHVVLQDLILPARIGTYGPGDVVPTAHLLDLELVIDPALALIAADQMSSVFDYDPLIAKIDALAKDGVYQTQERLITRILAVCAGYDAIRGASIYLRKTPVLGDTGQLGLRVSVDATELAGLRDLA